MVSVSVATRAVLEDALIVGLRSEAIDMCSLDIDVLAVVAGVAAIALREDLMGEGIASVAAALGADSGDDGGKEG